MHFILCLIPSIWLLVMVFKSATHINVEAKRIAGLISGIQNRFNISFQQVAKQIGVTEQAMRKWCNGSSRPDYATQYILESMLRAGSISIIGTVGWDNHRGGRKTDGEIVYANTTTDLHG